MVEVELGSDFTVVIQVRQHFGNEEDAFSGVFAGANKEFRFVCPDVDQARLQFFFSKHSGLIMVGTLLQSTVSEPLGSLRSLVGSL